MFSRKTFILILVIGLSVTALPADDLTGVSSFVCSTASAIVCPAGEECEVVAGWKLNIPQFIVFDLEQKTLRTTEASGENRVSPIEHLERENGEILVQGAEMGRAFSFVIDELSGVMSAAVASVGRGVVGFGACTPHPTK
jgi:hypothetical protein